MRDQVTDEDVGKPVVHGDDQIGRIVDYEDETAYVDPDPGITDTIAVKLGIEDHGEEDFPLQRELVDEVGDDEIRLKTEM